MESIGKIKSNKFYIGDICYVLNDDLYQNIWGGKYDFRDGVIDFGINQVLVHGTAYGDGCYSDNKGNTYGVDAGVIGVVPEELIDWDKIEKDYGSKDKIYELGNIVTAQEAELIYDNGTFYINVTNDGYENTYVICTGESKDMSYYTDQLDEIRDTVMTFARECKAIGCDYQAQQLDSILDSIDEIEF